MKTESVWDYPRPPKLEPTSRRIRVVHRGVTLADSVHCLRVLETSHPPVYYIPRAEIAMEYLSKSPGKSSYCEFKGSATYWELEMGGPGETAERVKAAAWSCEAPSPSFAGLAGALAFYASRVEECWVDEERVDAQAGSFYGGWITSDLVGPFKGAPGTLGW